MERALFKGWTENQLREAFATVNSKRKILKRPPCSEDFWRTAAYVAMLTGGPLPPAPTP